MAHFIFNKFGGVHPVWVPSRETYGIDYNFNYKEHEFISAEYEFPNDGLDGETITLYPENK